MKINSKILVGLMVTALVGLCCLQGYWISNAYNIRAHHFDQQVGDALSDVVRHLESQESVNFINKSFEKEITCYDNVDSCTKNVGLVISQFVDSTDVVIECSCDSNDICEHMSIGINYGAKKINKRAFKIMMSQGSNAENKMAAAVGKERFAKVMKRIVVEFSNRENPVEHLVGDQNLDKTLRTKLKDNGVLLPFRYAIISGDSIHPKFSSEEIVGLDDSGHRINLFSGHIKTYNHELVVDFAGLNGHLLKSIGMMLVASLLFVIIIIITFTYTLRTMLTQKRLSDIKSDFINNMSHELKTPAATISLAVDSIRHPKINAGKEVLNYVDIIKSENQRISEHVERLLQTTLLEKGEEQLQIEEFELAALMSEIENAVRPTLNENDHLQVEIKPGAEMFKGDRFLIRSAILNLIDNAIKYSQNVNVNVVIKVLDLQWHFEVADKGIGMSTDVIKHVFEKFYRAQSGNIHDVKGFGIGLSHVKAVAERHDGKVQVNSKPGIGSTFTLILPKI